MHTEKMMKESTLNILKTLNFLKGSNVLVTTTTILCFLASIPSAISNTRIEGGWVHPMPPWYGTRLPHNDQNAPTPDTRDNLSGRARPARRYVRVDWNKVMPQVNAFIHMKPAENAADCLSRAQEETKFFLASFENDYGVHVVWEDAQNNYPDMTEKLLCYVRQIQAIRHMTGIDIEAFETAMLQIKQKIASERGASQ